MINGYIGVIGISNLKKILYHNNTLNLWMSYFCMKFSTINIEPCYVQLSIENENIKIMKVDSNEFINLSQIDFELIYLSESKEEATNIYNENIYFNIVNLENKIQELQNEYNKFSGNIKYAENCFINTDLTMEKLTRE